MKDKMPQYVKVNIGKIAVFTRKISQACKACAHSEFKTISRRGLIVGCEDGLSYGFRWIVYVPESGAHYVEGKDIVSMETGPSKF